MVLEQILLLTKQLGQKHQQPFSCLMQHAASNKKMVADASDQAVWLVEGFVPGPKSIGVIEAVKMGAKPYPMLPQMGLMHALNPFAATLDMVLHPFSQLQLHQ